MLLTKTTKLLRNNIGGYPIWNYAGSTDKKSKLYIYEIIFSIGSLIGLSSYMFYCYKFNNNKKLLNN